MARWLSAVVALGAALVAEAQAPTAARGPRVSLEAALAAYRAQESVSAVVPTFELALRDSRRFQTDTVPLGAIDRVVQEQVGGRGGAPLAAWAPRLQLRLDVGFFGLERTEGGTWLARANVQLDVIDATDARAVLVQRQISLDSILRGRQTDATKATASQRLLDRFAAELRDQLAALDTMAGSAYRQVVAVGYAPAKALTDSTRRLATLDALRSAAAKAWGMEVEGVTRVVDLADVSSVTSSRTRGLLRWHAVRPGSEQLTADGHLVLLVDAVIGLPQR